MFGGSMVEEKYDFTKRLETVHKPFLRQPNVTLEHDEILIEDGWTILVSD